MEQDRMIMIPEQRQSELILASNEFSQQFALSLSRQDVEELMLHRRACLLRQQRVEFGAGILEKLIFAFCDSQYIHQDNYEETLERLQEIFYLYKDESMDEWSDDELISRMRSAFEGVCQGSLDYLEGTYLEKFARKTRIRRPKEKLDYALTEQMAATWYPLEELLPIVGKLAEEYNSRESSSVSFDMARQLMDAVIFCIGHSVQENQVMTAGERMSAKTAYEIGYQAVVRKLKKTTLKYHRLLTFFDDYGNLNYRDTVKKALAEFFRRYDPKYAPLETMITMDYPVFGMNHDWYGIDRIGQYLDKIYEEQKLLQKLDRVFVVEELQKFHPFYEGEYFNLMEILKSSLSGDIEE